MDMPTGIVGLRLFPNPDFDEAAAKKWDAKRYYNDPSYYNDKDLVRPYRVGMSCGFCHVGPSPIKPPADPEHPKWAESQLECRRAVFLGRPHLRLGGRADQLSVPALPYVAAGHAGYVAGLDRQHQQPAHDERGLRAWAAAGSGEALGQGDVGGRRAQQQAVQRFRQRRAADARSFSRRTRSGRRAC